MCFIISFIFLLIFIIAPLLVLYRNSTKVLIALPISFIIIVGLTLLISYPHIRATLFPSFTETLKSNWQLDLPEPNNFIQVASDIGGFPSDGESFNILIYNDVNAVNKIGGLEWLHKSDWLVNEAQNIIYDLERNSKQRDNIKKVPH